MKALRRLGCFLLMGSFIAMTGVTGCTKKPNKEELTKVEEAKSAAESAERKLSELRQERVTLESTLQQKQADLQKNESERDDVKKKSGK
jgi:hypothetical protein